MKKSVLTAITSVILSACLAVSAFAVSSGEAIPYNEGTDVYAGVILKDPDARIRVYVPTLFAFVVNGSVEKDATQAISVENGSLLLPNVKVNVEESGMSGKRNYQIETVGTGNMYFENCSTVLKTTPEDENAREGIPVSITGSIKNEGTDESRNFWKHVAEKPGTEAKDFKNYRLTIKPSETEDEIPFSVVSRDGFTMKNSIKLPAPDLGYRGKNDYTNMDADSKLAIIGSKKSVDFGVEVGGKQNDYQQVEESVKIGNIVWTIGYDITNDGATNTSPDEKPHETAPVVPKP